MVFLNPVKFVDQSFSMLCGIDEVGRGPWAGPVVACALVFKKEPKFRGLKDSKQLTSEQREKFYKKIEKISYYGIGSADHVEIDKMGIIKASNLAFVRALEQLKEKHGVTPDYLIVDGRDKLKLPVKHTCVIKGDEKIKIVACASIMAKVERDHYMRDIAKIYPSYGFERHKGYGTKSHQQAIKEYGICDIHRKSYKPIIQQALF